jgi:hypothetical protein
MSSVVSLGMPNWGPATIQIYQFSFIRHNSQFQQEHRPSDLISEEHHIV